MHLMNSCYGDRGYQLTFCGEEDVTNMGPEWFIDTTGNPWESTCEACLEAYDLEYGGFPQLYTRCRHELPWQTQIRDRRKSSLSLKPPRCV